MMRRAYAPAMVALLGFVLTACGGSSSGGSTATTSTSPTPATSAGASTSAAPAQTGPADPAAAKAEITKVWEKFFRTGTPRSVASKLLEDGDQLGAAQRVAAREDKQTQLVRRAQVKRIDFLTPTTASVTWVLLNKTTPVLPNASGQAVLVDGHWKVSKLTFCTLVGLGNNGKPVPGCD